MVDVSRVGSRRGSSGGEMEVKEVVLQTEG